nr:hypothetical protein [Tanacetum cinerariifolium]
LIAEKTKVSKSKEKVVVSLDSEGKLIEKNNDLLAQTKLLKEQLQVKHVMIDTHAECQEIYAKLEAERYEYMIRYFAYFDNDKQHRKQIADQEVFSLKPYVPNVILEKIIIDLEDEVVNLLEKEKVYLETIESLKSKSFESSEQVTFESENQTENDRLVVKKEYDKEENPKVIAPRMFKLSVSQCVLPISKLKLPCESNNVEIKLKRNRHNFSSVRRPKNSGVIWKKKGSSNTSNVGLSAVSVSNLNKNVKRYSHKDLLASNNSHQGETSSASVCNNAMNVSCNSRMNDLLDDNNFFIFDDVNVRIAPVSKMPFRKKPRDSMEDKLKLKELMKLSTKLSDRVLDLEKIKTAQAKEIVDLKKRVKKLERKRRSKTLGMNLFKIGTSRRRSLGEEDASKHGRNLKQRGGLLGLKDFLVLLKLLLLVMVSTAAKVNATSEYGYYSLKSMFEEKLQLLVNVDINAD